MRCLCMRRGLDFKTKANRTYTTDLRGENVELSTEHALDDFEGSGDFDELSVHSLAAGLEGDLELIKEVVDGNEGLLIVDALLDFFEGEVLSIFGRGWNKSSKTDRDPKKKKKD